MARRRTKDETIEHILATGEMPPPDAVGAEVLDPIDQALADDEAARAFQDLIDAAPPGAEPDPPSVSAGGPGVPVDRRPALPFTLWRCHRATCPVRYFRAANAETAAQWYRDQYRLHESREVTVEEVTCGHDASRAAG